MERVDQVKVSRREFLGGSLFLGSLLAIGGSAADMIFNTHDGLEAVNIEASKAYPSLVSGAELSEAKQYTAHFETNSKNLAREGKLNQIPDLAEPDKLRRSYEMIDGETGRQRSIQTLSREISQERRSAKNGNWVVMVFASATVLMGEIVWIKENSKRNRENRRLERNSHLETHPVSQ